MFILLDTETMKIYRSGSEYNMLPSTTSLRSENRIDLRHQDDDEQSEYGVGNYCSYEGRANGRHAEPLRRAVPS